MGGLQSFTLRSGQPEQTVDFGAGGGTVSVVGGTVYYRDEPGVTASVNDGSIVDGGSVILLGTQFFSTTASRVDGQVRLADVAASTTTVVIAQIIRARHVFKLGASSTFYTFPPRLRAYEPSRRLAIVRNIGISPMRVAYGVYDDNTVTKPVDAAFTANGIIQPGEQIELGPDPRAIWGRAVTSGDSLAVEIYVETGAL